MRIADATKFWDTYVAEQNKEPLYARVMIEWHKDGCRQNVTIALRPYDEKRDALYDDDIFFYADGRSDFLRLFSLKSGEDFFITDIYYLSQKFVLPFN